MSVFRVILVHIFPVFSRIRTEYGEILWIREILCISPYWVQMRKNAGKMWTRITPTTGTFYAVKILMEGGSYSTKISIKSIKIFITTKQINCNRNLQIWYYYTYKRIELVWCIQLIMGKSGFICAFRVFLGLK